jgi:hypothetical protein
MPGLYGKEEHPRRALILKKAIIFFIVGIINIVNAAQ